MTSNLLSRFLPSNTAPSIYEDLRAQDAGSESDLEERAGLSIDEENLGGAYDDYTLDNVDNIDPQGSHINTESTAFLPRDRGRGQDAKAQTSKRRTDSKKNSNWLSRSPRLLDDDGDDDVPASLLIEGDDEAGPSEQQRQHNSPRYPPGRGPASVGVQTKDTRSRWETAQAQQRLHADDQSRPSVPAVQPVGGPLVSDRDKAMWTWLNASNLDHFMEEVYSYYVGSGIWCIVLTRILNILSLVFVAVFTTFLTQCINYKAIPTSKTMPEILVPQCTKRISGLWNVAIWLLVLGVFWTVLGQLRDLPRLWSMHNFYLHLLGVPDRDIQTVSWQEIVGRIMALRDSHPLTTTKVSPNQKRWLGSQSKERLDAHDIANRLMRKENYLIALFNKEILDLTVPIPFLRGRQFFSQVMHWNLEYCILDFVFNEQGQIRQLVLKDTKRRELSAAMQGRFRFAAVASIVCAPFIVIFLLIIYFFRYFNEYKANPSALSSRQYTLLAEWKFREFNELPHLFKKRLDMSYPFASRYVEQFPKKKVAKVAEFVALVAGAVVSVLALASVIDPELFLNFEITQNRTVLFYLGLFGAIWAGARGAIPEENLVFDPEYALRNVIEYTRYEPVSWTDRLHSDEVKGEFSELYQSRIVVFLEEILSIILTPLVLWWSLPQCSDRIIDFFREFTVHVDGLGYVCSFAVFDFKKGVGNVKGRSGATADGLREDYYSTKHGKMAASFYGFLDNYATNPKTGIPGHVPPGLRHQFHPPPQFPGLMSPGLVADMQGSRIGRSGRYANKQPAGVVGTSRTPRFTPAAAHPSPMASLLLDPHHQPSTTAMEKRSMYGQRSTRSKFLPARDIIEDEENEASIYSPKHDGGRNHEDVISRLDESRWETSPTRTMAKSADDADDGANEGGAGVLGLLYEFQKKAQSDGRGPGVQI